MATFRIVTTTDRAFLASTGEPITSMADGEQIATVRNLDPKAPLSDEDRTWMREAVLPLLKLSGAEIGWSSGKRR